MKKSHKVILFFLPFMLFSFLQFASPSQDGKKEKKWTGKEILQKAIEKIQGKKKGVLKSLSYQQYLDIESPAGTLKAEGTIYYQHPDKLFIRGKVLGVEVEEGFDGKRGWTRQFGRVQEIPSSQMGHIQRILRGIKGQFLEPLLKGKIRLLGEKKVENNQDAFLLEVQLPKGKVHLYIGKKDFVLLRRINFSPLNKEAILVDYRDGEKRKGFYFFRRILLFEKGKKIGSAQNGSFEVNGDIPKKLFQCPLPPKENKNIKKKETPKKETPKKETPKKETPKKETPQNETPKKEAPKKETPKKKTPK